MSAKDSAKDVLANHPRLIGVLFATMLLLSQAGTVAAGFSQTQVGP